jgi:hypothetical protein
VSLSLYGRAEAVFNFCTKVFQFLRIPKRVSSKIPQTALVRVPPAARIMRWTGLSRCKYRKGKTRKNGLQSERGDGKNPSVLFPPHPSFLAKRLTGRVAGG